MNERHIGANENRERNFFTDIDSPKVLRGALLEVDGPLIVFERHDITSWKSLQGVGTTQQGREGGRGGEGGKERKDWGEGEI